MEVLLKIGFGVRGATHIAPFDFLVMWRYWFMFKRNQISIIEVIRNHCLSIVRWWLLSMCFQIQWIPKGFMIDLNNPIVLDYLLIFKNNSLLLIQFPTIIQLYVYQMTVLKLFTLKKNDAKPAFGATFQYLRY